jgi:large subunit ribosomal protein L4
VSGSTRKIYSQKHTGRARRGDIKSPLLRGGGVVFGPKPRIYRQSMPKKMRKLALKCLLSAKVREGNIKLIQELDFKGPKTKDMINVLSSLGIDSSTLILTAQSTTNVVKSAANLPEVKVLPSTLINVLDLLSYEVLVATVPAIRNIEQIWGK